jgi:membrane protein DedA with SNARE-associated domain/rhodanese-related sulfurtransferase
MELPTHILLAYGYLLLFVWVLVEQFGVPLPATPVLLAAGALSARGQLGLPEALAFGVAACLVSDISWFFVGRRYGHHVLNFLCRMSMEPTVCVNRTRRQFEKRRYLTLLFGKFVPGVATLSPPVAGQTGMRFTEFLALDAIGSVIWVGSFLLSGRLFGDALKRDPNLMQWVEHFSGALLLLAILIFFAARVIRRRILLRQLTQSRMEPEELWGQLQSGEAVYIVDLRHPLELVNDPYTLPGALRVAPDDLARRAREIPRDRDVILYCTCPNEETAAYTAMKLHRLGVERVRPLRGGYHGWQQAGYPMDAIPPVNPPQPLVQLR